MDFAFSPDICALRDRTRQFIAEQVIPLENDERQSSHGPSDALRRELVGRAHEADLLTPHAFISLGGCARSATWPLGARSPSGTGYAISR